MKANYSITVGITTYNRIDYLKKMRDSLYGCHDLDKCNLRVYDDCSEQFDLAFLSELFPGAKEIVRRPANLGAEGNLRQMYVDFLSTGDDLLFTADSDLIFNPSWIEFLLENFQHTDGVLSLINSAIHHKTSNELVIGGSQFDEKPHLGAAGVVIHKNLVRKIVDQINSPTGFDWVWSAYLIENNIRLLASRESFVQHIGLHGVNCDGFLTVEIGNKFKPVNYLNTEIILDSYVGTIVELQKQIRRQHKKIRLIQGTWLGRVSVASIEMKKRCRKISRKTLRKLKKKFQRVWQRSQGHGVFHKRI